MSTKNNELTAKEYSCNGKIITFNAPLVMAIVNLTPDSFYDGGKFDSTYSILRDVEEKVGLGADIIDIGASSTRPGAPVIPQELEWSRLEPVLTAIRSRFPEIVVSVDTYRAETARRSAETGANIINDIGGGSLDANMFGVIAGLETAYVLTHIRGTPQTMQENPVYGDVVSDVRTELGKKADELRTLGFTKIILDPGFGFGKTLRHNYQLLKGLPDLLEYGFPVLAGVSRKGMIYRLLNASPVTALNGTSVVHTIALLNGASILRVHDVKEAKEAIRLVEYFKNA